MKDVLLIFLFVTIVAAIGMATVDEYDFPTGDLTRCRMEEERQNCGIEGWCENVDGGNGGIDGRRGHQCRAKFPAGVSCIEHKHCRSGYCNPNKKICTNPPDK